MLYNRTVATVLALAATPVLADVDAGLTALDAGDVATAAVEFQEAFEAGNGDGAFYLGRLFEFGVGAEVDMVRAANLYAAAAEAESILAMNRLGLLYLEGTTLLQDYAKAAAQFCEAAALGDATGQLNCALMMQDGRGIAQDTAQAVTYLEAAAGQGNIAAQNLLAQRLLDGEGVTQDVERALALFEETANSGNAMGLFELAEHNADTGNLVEAHMYANLAVVRGHSAALALRTGLEARMTPAQVTEAQGMAGAWTDARIAEQAAAAQE